MLPIKIGVTVPVKWVKHNGTDILVLDYSTLSGSEAYLEALHKCYQEFKKTNGPINFLINYTDHKIYQSNINEAFKLGKELTLQDRFGKTAAIGVNSAHVVYTKFYILFTGNKNYKTFKTEKEALDWLSGK